LEVFDGIKILDVTRLLPGGYATQYFAELGAEVIKVEDMGAGDYLRELGPSFSDDSTMSSYYFATNYNKKSICLDLKTEEGLTIFKQMAKSADIVIEGFRPGTTARLGIDYGSLKEINPALIYCSISAFGQNGPRSQDPGHDINILSLTGFLDVNGVVKDSKPAIPGTQFADIGSGISSILSIVTALYQRNVTGSGQYLDISMYDVMGTWMLNPYLDYLATSRVSHKGAELLSGGVLCYHIYETSDHRHLAFGAIEEKFWESICNALGLPELKDEAFTVTREDNIHYIKLKEAIASKPFDEWVPFFKRLNCCVTPVLTTEEVMKDAHFNARQIVEKIPLRQNHFPKIRGPLPFSETQIEERNWSYPPKQGQQTVEILLENGYTEQQINEFLIKGIVRNSN